MRQLHLCNTKEYFQITRDDGRPQTVCYICRSLLQRLYDFTAMAKRSDRVLRHFLGLGVQASCISLFISTITNNTRKWLALYWDICFTMWYK